MSDQKNIHILVSKISALLEERRQKVSTVESCTGGGIAHALTAIAGSSQWFEYGLVTYSDTAKTELAGVSPELLTQYGAVSIEVAAAMTEGGRRVARSDYAVSVTGIAGPGGGSEEKPVGTVCFGWVGPQRQVETERQVFSGDRETIRVQSVHYALQGLLERM